MHAASGFTLIEALVALAVVAILLCLAVPALSNASEAVHNGSAQAALGASILGAVHHAAATGAEVVLCPGDAGGCRSTVDWSRGWVAFADIDGDRQRDQADTLLKQVGALGGDVHLRSTPGRTRLVFQPNGGNAGSNVTFTLCDGRGAEKAVTLVLANSGRLRSGTPSDAAAHACLAEM
jgi:type IV fimbrial biogenesis protein FimT